MTTSRRMAGRRLVAVDVENVVGGAVLTASQARRARSEISAILGVPGATDQVVIGVSHCGLLACWMAWQGPRYVVRSGVDGADLALLEVLTGENIETRFEEVVLVSGDGMFAPVAAALGAHGLRVTVLARPGALSASLQLAATDVRMISPIQHGQPVPAA